eukprot:5960581-Prorocentrum_lima.AAC.1
MDKEGWVEGERAQQAQCIDDWAVVVAANTTKERWRQLDIVGEEIQRQSTNIGTPINKDEGQS